MSAVISVALFILSKMVEEGLPLNDWYLNLCCECYSRNKEMINLLIMIITCYYSLQTKGDAFKSQIYTKFIQ